MIQSITGTKDQFSPDIEKWQTLEEKARQIFELYSYSEIRTPLLEETSLFVRGIGTETGVVQKEMYTFDDKGGDSVTLRPEGTASVVRAYIQHHLHKQDPTTKLYYIGPMFRYERPQKGRLRQFHQIGAELFGPASPEADVEVITLLNQIIRSCGVTDFQLEINSLGSQKTRLAYLEKLKTYLQKYQNDFGEDDRRRIETNPLRVIDTKDSKVQDIVNEAPLILNHLDESDQKHWDRVQDCLSNLQINYQINPRIVRGLDYYQQTAFECVSQNLGSQSAFAGGGRYDGLVEELGGPVTPAVGFAIGMERLLLLMSDEIASKAKRRVYIAFLGDSTQSKAMEIAQKLRTYNMVSEMGYESKSFKSQLRRANRLGFSHVIIIGENELKENKVQIKDFETQEQVDCDIDKIIPFFMA